MAKKNPRNSPEYIRFLKTFNLKKVPESFDLFKKYVTAVTTTKRATSNRTLPTEGLDQFRTTSAVLRSSGTRRDVRHTTEDSFLEIPGGDGHVYRSPFWVTSVTLGYGSSGNMAQSRLFNSYYAHSFTEDPLRIVGRVPSDEGLAGFSEFVRAGQLQMVLGNGLMRLRIPGAAIDYSGFIPSFNVNHEAGFPPAPEIEFEFVVVSRDGTTSNDISQQVLAYYLHPDDNYWKESARQFREDLYSKIESDFLNSLRADVRKEIKRQRREREAIEAVQRMF